MGEVREGESSRAAGTVGRDEGVEAVLPIAVAGVGAARCCCSSSAAATEWRDGRGGGEGTERKAGRVRGRVTCVVVFGGKYPLFRADNPIYGNGDNDIPFYGVTGVGDRLVSNWSLLRGLLCTNLEQLLASYARDLDSVDCYFMFIVCQL